MLSQQWTPRWLKSLPVRQAADRLRDAADDARDQRDWETAAGLYRRYLRRRPMDAALWVQLGHAEKERGALAPAQAAYSQACVLAPQDADAHLQLGHLLRAMGDNTAAHKSYEAAMRLDSNAAAEAVADHLRSLGDLARDRLDWPEAAAMYNRYLQTRPGDAAIWVQHGHAEKERGCLLEARASYERARDLAPDDPDVFVQLGHVLKLLSETDAAIEAYETALRLDPALEDARRDVTALAQLDLRRLSHPPIEADIRAALAPHFDGAFYLMANPHVLDAGHDPLAHYHLVGWREGRNPSRTFNVEYYLQRHGDVARSGMDPLLHWVWAGREEGRTSQPMLEAERRQLAQAEDPRRRARDWGGAADRSDPMSLAKLKALLDTMSLVVSVSQDNYTSHYGGVQNQIGDERKAFARWGVQYLHLSPASPLPVLAEPGDVEQFRFAVVLDGKHHGVAVTGDLAAALASLQAAGAAIQFVVHHLMGHDPACIAMLSQAAGAAKPTVWAHDFFTICPSYALMRNDVVYCGAPPVDSGACNVCSYGAARIEHSMRIRDFFEHTRPVVVTPSQAALDVWLAADLPRTAVEVRPGARLILAQAASDHTHRAGRRLRVAHIGARVLHKGWFAFEALALRFADDIRYEFMQFGVVSGVPLPGCIRQVPVQVTPDDRDAMVERLAEWGVDVVVAWSLWPETFCFTVHEALASGAFVVARRDAGNVWPVVAANAPAQGCEVADVEALGRLFASGELVELCRRPRRRGAVLPGGSLADRLVPAAPAAGTAAAVEVPARKELHNV